jgi:hypothetical protein
MSAASPHTGQSWLSAHFRRSGAGRSTLTGRLPHGRSGLSVRQAQSAGLRCHKAVRGSRRDGRAARSQEATAHPGRPIDVPAAGSGEPGRLGAAPARACRRPGELRRLHRAPLPAGPHCLACPAAPAAMRGGRCMTAAPEIRAELVNPFVPGLVGAQPDRAVLARRMKLALPGEAPARQYRVLLIWS